MQKTGFNVLHITAPCWSRLLLIFGIGIFILTHQYRFYSNEPTVRHQKISLDKPRRPLIGGFYHFATVTDHWRNIVIEQMTMANLSGLFDATSVIYVTGLGRIPENKNISGIFADPKFVYEYNNTNPELYEFPTLLKLEKFCLYNSKALVWYAHSKGASHFPDDVAQWRGVMNHFVLDKWQLCYYPLITENYTTCGALLTFESARVSGWNIYYAGNMWWAKCSQVNKLRRIEKIDQKDRYNAELYVTSEPVIGQLNCFHANILKPWKFTKENATCSVSQPLWDIRAG